MQACANAGLDVCIRELARKLVSGLPTCAMPGDNYVWSNVDQFVDCPWDDGLEDAACQVETSNKCVNVLDAGYSLGMADNIDRSSMAAT